MSTINSNGEVQDEYHLTLILKVEAAKKHKREYLREYRKEHPELRAAGARKTRYGISQEEYSNMLIKQDFKCAICRTLPEENMSLSVDHNHDTNEVRGLLCSRCNFAVGWIEQYKDRLPELVAYVTNNT